MIKVVNLLALILAPLLVMIENNVATDPNIATAAIAALLVLLVLTIWSIRKSMKPADFGMVREVPVEAVQ
ncbi:MAG: hypothetical protein ACXACG_07740 [Candidatus Thorarchaeota archaeon]|jgi:uncharacterized membrane protein YqjE